MVARVDHAADPDPITHFEFADLAADGHHSTDDFMTRYDGIVGPAPVIASGVQIGVADAAIKNVDFHIIGARWSASDGVQRQRRRGRGGGIGFDGLDHDCLL